MRLIPLFQNRLALTGLTLAVGIFAAACSSRSPTAPTAVSPLPGVRANHGRGPAHLLAFIQSVIETGWFRFNGVVRASIRAFSS